MDKKHMARCQRKMDDLRTWTFFRSWCTAFTVSLLLVAATSCGSNGPSSDESASGGGEDAASATNPAADFVRFAESDFTGEDADYVAEGLRSLAGALGALNAGPPELNVDLRVAAEHVLLNPTSPATTATVRAGLVSAARALDAAQETGPSVAPLVESIRSDVPLPDQIAEVREGVRKLCRPVPVHELRPRRHGQSRCIHEGRPLARLRLGAILRTIG
jgi:hypothetical protein